MNASAVKFLLVALMHHAAFTQDIPFITRKDGVLFEGDKPFRFVSYDAPGLFMTEDRPPCEKQLFGIPVCPVYPLNNPAFDKDGYAYGTVKGTGSKCIENLVSCRQSFPESFVDDNNQWEISSKYEQEDLIQTVALMSGRVIRTFPFLIGVKQHIDSLRSYYEPAWVAVDHAIATARKHNVRLIIPFINNHWRGDDSPPSLASEIGYWTKLRKLPPSAFYTNKDLIDDFKHFITFVLNRVNTVTGVRYGDDPTIMAWETGNELGGAGVPQPELAQTASWTIDIAKHIKSLAPKTLVMDGRSCKRECPSELHKETLQSEFLDIFSVHYYDPDDYDRIGRDTEFVTGFGKAFMIGEFGMEDTGSYKPLIDAGFKTKVSGFLYWSLRGHGEYGGFNSHKEVFGVEASRLSVHAPGFEPKANFSGDEKDVAEMMLGFARQFAGVDTNSGFPEPPAAQPLDVAVHPARLRFKGSSWALKYTMFRQVCQDASCKTVAEDWKTVTNIQDSVVQGNAVWSETDESLRDKFLRYQIQPEGRTGKIGPNATIGPYKFSNDSLPQLNHATSHGSRDFSNAKNAILQISIAFAILTTKIQ